MVVGGGSGMIGGKWRAGYAVGEGEGDGGWLDGNVGVHYNGMEVNVYIVCNMYVCVYILLYAYNFEYYDSPSMT